MFQWLFDEAQMRADNVGAPVTPQQWDYIHEMGGALRASLENVTAVFAPSCIGHSVLTKRDWQNIKIDDVSFTDSLRCWENTLLKDRKSFKKNNKIGDDNKLKNGEGNKRSKHNKNKKKKNHQSDQPQNHKRLSPEERERRRQQQRENRRKWTPEERKQHRLERQERKRRREQRLQEKMEAKNQTPRAQRSPQELEMNSNKNLLPKIIENEPVAKQQQKKRRQQVNQKRKMEAAAARNATRLPKQHRRNHRNQEQLSQQRPNKRRHDRERMLKAQNDFLNEITEPKKCELRLIERCSWPQCNHSCPSLTNPLTGEEMKFLELLTSFGLDMDAVAQALGVDMPTLNNMDHKELIKLFTESTS